MVSGAIDKTFIRTAVCHLLVVAIIQTVIGCTPSFNIHTDGYPVARETELTWSGNGKMSAQWLSARFHPVTVVSGKQSAVVSKPEYLSPDKLNRLAADTSAVMTRLDVNNPAGLRYRVVQIVDIGGGLTQEPVTGWTIRPYQSLNIANPLVRKQEVEVSLIVCTDEGEDCAMPIMTTAEMRYIIN